MLSLGVVGAAVVAAFLYAIWPLVRPPEETEGLLVSSNGHETREQEIARLLVERDHAYKAIGDIEFDRQMGKLADEDFAQMMVPARAHALAILRRLEARGVGEGAVPVLVSEREADEVAEQVTAAAPDAPEADEPEEDEPDLDARLEREILALRKVKPPEAPAAPQAKPAPRPKAAAPSPASGPAAVNFCPSCGAQAGAGHNFCASCGSKLR